MSVEHVFAHVGVAEAAAAVAWYERLFGRMPDLVPKDGEAVWRLTETGWLTVGGDAEPTGRAHFTALVDDLDAEIAELTGRGIDAGEIETAPGLYRRIVLTDPEGNTIVLAEPFAGG